jgi:prepilin-type N-terminal cleavage/methylation domain-containing protein
MLRRAFTMIELVFVIVIMGIIGKFGVEFLARAYESFFITTLQNRLQQQSEAAVTQIAARLQYRIKSSVVMSAGGNKLEWVGYDIDGWRGHWDSTANMNLPNWSGFINIDVSTTPNINFLSTPESNTSAISNTIAALSGDKTISNAAIFFTGASNPTSTIWDGNVSDQAGELAHPIKASGTSGFATDVDNFSDVDVYEFYKLAWSAYTVELNTSSNKLILYYNYQPWNGDTNSNANQSILMENVDSFNYQTIGDLIKVQVCVHGDNIGENISVCKEKTVF